MTFYGFLVSTTKDPRKWWGRTYQQYQEFEKMIEKKFGCDYCSYGYAGDYLRDRADDLITTKEVSVPVIPEVDEYFGYTGIEGKGKVFQILGVAPEICDTELSFILDGRLLTAQEFFDYAKKCNEPMYIYALAHYHN